MTVRIEITADNGAVAAAELQQLLGSLAAQGHLQRLGALSSFKQSGFKVAEPAEPKAVDTTATEIAAKMEAAGVVKKTPEDLQPEPAKEAATEEPAKPKKSRKSKAEKEAEAAVEPATLEINDDKDFGDKTSDQPATSKAAEPNYYKLFDEDGKEEELFDTADQFKTALKTMLTDAPDLLTLRVVAKANEPTMVRMRDEEVDFQDVLDAFKARQTDLTPKAATEEKPVEAPATEEAKAEAPATDAKSLTVEDIKDAIKLIAGSKKGGGLEVARKIMAEFGASKASEVKEADRAAFVAKAQEFAE